MRTFLISGEPALWSAGADHRSVEREEQWKNRIRNALQSWTPASRTVLLHFSVKEWTRRGHHFDLDNLVTPVFRAIYGNSNRERMDARTTLASWRASIGQSPAPSLLLDFLDEPLHDLDRLNDARFLIDETWTGLLPSNSRDGDCGLSAWIRQYMGDFLPSELDRFGVRLVFNDTISNLTRPEEKPIKPVIDCLYPIFGGMPARGDDWKKLFLQIERQPTLQGSMHIQCWLLQRSADLH